MALGIRKLETKEEIERKRKRNTLILSIIMIGILMFSTAGYFSLRENDEGNANGGVQNIGDYWIFTYGDQNIRLSSSPESAENVSILMFKTLESYYGKTVYVSSESETQLYEISSTLGRYTERMQAACYGKCDRNLPEKNCSDILIVIRALNETEKEGEGKIYEEQNCVFIEGKMNAIDAFLYKIFGII